ncbi:MAG: prephenate dehydratase [Desulfuromonadaceae bacterium]|nr:prephenate dehydratase [Desulfuromonadaceae bacterium]
MLDDRKLDNLRQKIDAIDDQILELLNRRSALVIEVGRLKAANGLPFFVPSRERAIYDRLAANNPGPFPSSAIRSVYREIISASLSLEQPLSVAYLGPKATFTQEAAIRQFGLSARFVPAKSIPAVFDEVNRARADYGVVPVENSNEGIVSHTLDMFLDSELKIYAEILLEVTQSLLSLSGRMEDVRKVVSHPHALAQCRNWLEENLPEVPQVDVSSTARAAEMAMEDGDCAALASEMAATLYGLRVVQRKIEDNPNNFTRFLVIARTSPQPSSHDKTSLMFSVRDAPGILCRMLEPFRKRNINLTKIESRPIKKKAWEYVFFLDLEGHLSQPEIAAAVEELRSHCQFVKVLGSYPRTITLRQE